MQEQLISFDTAKLAKEKGFNIESSKHYFSSDGLPYENETISTYDCYHRPTQSLLQKWLREVHKCIVYVTFYNNGEEWEDTEYKVIVSEFKHFATHDSFVKIEFSSYEEALEIGLQEALKLI